VDFNYSTYFVEIFFLVKQKCDSFLFIWIENPLYSLSTDLKLHFCEQKLFFLLKKRKTKWRFFTRRLVIWVIWNPFLLFYGDIWVVILFIFWWSLEARLSKIKPKILVHSRSKFRVAELLAKILAIHFSNLIISIIKGCRQSILLHNISPQKKRPLTK
jgi:hypothetical protein